MIAGWIYLYGSRVFAWWLIGSKLASIRGKRLVGWIAGGTAINLTFDASLVMGLITNWPAHVVAALVVLAFIAALELIGKRPALQARFTEPLCVNCAYNLTGNLSGICPECGTVIDQTTLAKIPDTPPAA